MPITAIPRSIRSIAVLYGVGTSSVPFVAPGTGKNFLGFWLKSAAPSGDTRGIYMRLYLNGIGAGEAARFYATALAANVATGGTMNGIHASASVDASPASISGAANAGRFTFGAAAVTRTLTGTISAVQLDSDIATGNTLPASHAFMRLTDSGAVRFTNFLEVPTVSNGTIFAAHTTQVLTHSIKIRSAAGTAYYIMCTDAATNRS